MCHWDMAVRAAKEPDSESETFNEQVWESDFGHMSTKMRKFRTDKFQGETNGSLGRATHVNGWDRVVYIM